MASRLVRLSGSAGPEQIGAGIRQLAHSFTMPESRQTSLIVDEIVIG